MLIRTCVHVTHVRGLGIEAEVGGRVGVGHLLIVVPHHHVTIYGLSKGSMPKYTANYAFPASGGCSYNIYMHSISIKIPRDSGVRQ